jgi:hypothetical protein
MPNKNADQDARLILQLGRLREDAEMRKRVVGEATNSGLAPPPTT